MRRVVVTGLGLVCALGHDVASTWQGVREGRCGIGPIRTIPTERLGVRIAAEVQGLDPARILGERRAASLDRASQLAMIAAGEAWADAAAPLPSDPRRAGAILGGAIGYATFDAAYLALYGQNAPRVPPLTVPRIMPSASASHVSMAFGLRGPSYATTSACASATHAIGLAFEAIRSGRLDVAVAGGSDAPLTVGVLKGWEALRVLSADACRPFSRDRSGIVLGEGAGILVLEERSRALARGARIHAELAGFGMGADAGELTAPDAEGCAWAMAEALRDADLPPEAIGYVCAHGTGTRLNDRTEAGALRLVFGARTPPVSAPKSMLGHTMCASGGIGAALTVLGLRDGVLPPTIGFREGDPDCDLDCIPNQARAVQVEAALCNAFAFGGLNAVLAFRR